MSQLYVAELCIAYRITIITKLKKSKLLKISEHFLKFLENSLEDYPKFIRTFLIVFQKFPMMSKDFWRLLSWGCRIFPSSLWRCIGNNFRFIRRLNLLNLIAHNYMTSLISSHVISNLFSHVKLLCFTLREILLVHRSLYNKHDYFIYNQTSSKLSPMGRSIAIDFTGGVCLWEVETYKTP